MNKSTNLKELLEYASKRSNISYIDFLETTPNKMKKLPILKTLWEKDKTKTYSEFLRKGGTIPKKKISDKRDFIFRNGGSLSQLKVSMNKDSGFDAFIKSSSKYKTKTISNYIAYKNIIKEPLNI